jgi:hypothetical protein
MVPKEGVHSCVAEEPAEQIVAQIADVFGIGSYARDKKTILANVTNAARRSACLSRVELNPMPEEEPTEKSCETCGYGPTKKPDGPRCSTCKGHKNWVPRTPEPREGKELPPTQEDMKKMRVKFDKAAAQYPDKELPWVELPLNYEQGYLKYRDTDGVWRKVANCKHAICGYRFEDGTVRTKDPCRYWVLPPDQAGVPAAETVAYTLLPDEVEYTTRIEWATKVCFPR